MEKSKIKMISHYNVHDYDDEYKVIFDDIMDGEHNNLPDIKYQQLFWAITDQVNKTETEIVFIMCVML